MTGPARAGSTLIPGDVRGALVLVRHGESTFIAQGRFQGRQDPPLSEVGERQADLAAAWLASPDRLIDPGLAGPPREIVHSPLARAAQTATRIRAAFTPSPPSRHRPSLRAEPRLIEIGQGDWEGRTHDEVTARWAERLAAWRRHPTRAWAPGGERLSAADRRVHEAVPALLAPLRADAATRATPWTIVVAHDGILRILVLALLRLPLDRFWAFPFALGGATIVDLVDSRASLRAHNLTAHLPDAAAAAPRGSTPDREGAL